MQTLFIEPGRMRHELALEVCATVPDGMGGHSEAWSKVGTVFASIEPVAATSRFGAGQTLETASHRITMRAREGVASGMRLRRGSRMFEIVTVHDPDESGRYLVCRVQESGK